MPRLIVEWPSKLEYQAMMVVPFHSRFHWHQCTAVDASVSTHRCRHIVSKLIDIIELTAPLAS